MPASPDKQFRFLTVVTIVKDQMSTVFFNP